MGHIAHLWKKYVRVAGLLKIIIIPSWKRAWSFIWKWNFNPQHLTSLVEICPVVLRKKSFKVVNVFSLCCNYLPFEESVVLLLKKKKRIPNTEGSSVPNLIEIGPIILKLFNFYEVFLLLSPLGKESGSSYEQTSIPIIQLMDALCQGWLKLAQWFWRRK